MAGVLTADEVLEFRGLVESLAFHDTYALKQDTRTPDNEGGWTTVEATVESGACELTAGLSKPDERALAGDRITSTTPYVVSLPYATVADASDRLVIGGRTFEIIGVLKDGFLGMEARAVCEERQ